MVANCAILKSAICDCTGYRFLTIYVRIRSKEQAMPATISTSGNIARIDLSGEFDFSTQDYLNEVFDKVLDTAGNEIYVDMKNTIFIDSSVIRMFLKLRDLAMEHKKSMAILNCNERILEILTIGGFDQIFDIR